jgi:hypothetical protein
MLEDKLSNDEIRELWSEHFPKRLDNTKSRALCDIVRLVVEQRAAWYGGDPIVCLRHALAILRISYDEFYQVEKESADNLPGE